MAGNPLASLPGLPQRPSLARSSASETRLTQPGIEGARSRKLNSAPTAAFRVIRPSDEVVVQRAPGRQVLRNGAPLTPDAENVHHPVRHLADIDRTLVAAGLDWRNQRSDFTHSASLRSLS